MRRLEFRVLRFQRAQFVAHRAEAAIMRVRIFRRSAFALGDDRFARQLRSLGAEHRLGAAEIDLRRRKLQRGIAAEERLLAERLGHDVETGDHALIEFAHRVVVERHRREARRGRRAFEMTRALKARAFRFVGTDRALQEDEMLQHRFAERRELHDDARGQIARVERKIGASEPRRPADGSGDVPHRREVAHLVDRHIDDRAPPALRRPPLLPPYSPSASPSFSENAA